MTALFGKLASITIMRKHEPDYSREAPRPLPVALSWLFTTVLAVAPAPSPADSPRLADYSGLEPFWAVAELLAGDREVPAKAWEAMFATPGYRTLQQRDNADRFFERLLPLAVSPAKRDEAAATIAGQGVMETFLDHLRGAYEQRAALRAFRAELEGRPLLDEALTAAQAWLPAGSGARFGPPLLSFVIYQPDARGYDRIVMDLKLAFELPELFEGLLAHETHHVIRAGIQGPRDWGDLPEADLLSALDNLQAEGVADMINQPATLGVTDWGDSTTGRAMSLMTDRFREELARVEQRLGEVDAILAEYAANPDAAEDLGTRLRQTLVMGGHPVGFHMATVIVASGGRERMIDHVDDPFDFVRAYNDAAATDPGRHHVFGGDALRGLERLEGVARP